MKMRNYIYISICALLSVALQACQGDIEVKDVKSGFPAKLSLNIEVPASQEVSITRAIVDKESIVEDLVLVMIENSGRVEYVDLTSLLKASTGPTDKGGRTYTLNADYKSETLSGTYNIYAIANRKSAFANFDLDETTAKSMTDEKMKELIASNSKGLLAVDATTCAMSKIISEVTIKENETTKLAISLKRAVSHIEFEFKNGSHTKDDKTINASFTPEYYTVYNLPTQSYWFANDDKSAPTSTSYVNSTKQAVVGRSFEFMMLENIQKAKGTPDGGWNFNAREAWTGDVGSSVENKNFTYAPDNGTFIVVSGSYEDESYVGEVSYTIHLGDFSKNDYSNFAVNRNEYHKYTVTINGVENIIVESQNQGLNNGAEGELTKKTGAAFILDAHYETVLVEIPVTKVFLNETETDKNFIKFSTPKGTGEVALSDINTEDVDWIQFAKPQGSNGNYSFPLYKNYTTIKGLIDDIKNGGEETYYQQYNGSYWTVAFVDEYFYDELNPSQFVNAENRYFILNPTPIYTSTDGNSIFHSDSGFQIWQRPIITTYNLNSGMKAFGIETWDETGALPFGLDYTKKTALEGQSNLDGLANTHTLIKTLNNEGLSSSILGKVGYLTSVEDKTRKSHVWGKFDESSRTVSGVPVSNAIQACLARNRDLDGSGTIDLKNKNGENELKWYVPALYQYFIIWLGEELLPGDTRLFPQTDFTLNAYTTLQDKYPRFFTSSSNSKRTYWPDQGACWAVTYQYSGADKDMWMGDKQSLRCCRNLFNDSDNSQPSMPAVVVDNVIVISGIEYLRNYTVTGYLPQHTERTADNYLPTKFEVVSLDKTKNLNIAYYKGAELYNKMTDAAENYNESNNTSDIKWRIPNQREMMLMVMMGVLPESNNTNNRDYYLCSTWYSQEGKTGNVGKHVPFMYDIGGNGENNAVLFLPTQDGASGIVRLVRDYTGEVEGLTASDFDSSFEKGGTGAGVE